MNNLSFFIPDDNIRSLKRCHYGKNKQLIKIRGDLPLPFPNGAFGRLPATRSVLKLAGTGGGKETVLERVMEMGASKNKLPDQIYIRCPTLTCKSSEMGSI